VANTECVVECRIGAVAPMSDTLRVPGAQPGVNFVSRSHHCRHARYEGRGRSTGAPTRHHAVRVRADNVDWRPGTDRCIRRSAQVLSNSAFRSRSLVLAHSPVRTRTASGRCEGGWSHHRRPDALAVGQPDHRDTASLVKVLSASNAELAALSRSLSQLARLLGQGTVRAALVYRDSLDRAHGELRAHLKVAADALADLQPLVRLARQRRSTTEVQDE
jgi:hypothetical protein